MLGPNVFAYCKNNVANMKDPSGFRPVLTQGEETDEMIQASYKVMNKAARNKASISAPKDSFNSGASVLKSLASGGSDALAGKAASNIIKEHKVSKSLETLALSTYTSNLGKGAKAGKTVLGIAGSIGFCAWDVNKSLQQGEYVGASMDILAAAAGFGAGVLIGIGAAALVTASTPILLAGV